MQHLETTDDWITSKQCNGTLPTHVKWMLLIMPDDLPGVEAPSDLLFHKFGLMVAHAIAVRWENCKMRKE